MLGGGGEGSNGPAWAQETLAALWWRVLGSGLGLACLPAICNKHNQDASAADRTGNTFRAEHSLECLARCVFPVGISCLGPCPGTGNSEDSDLQKSRRSSSTLAFGFERVNPISFTHDAFRWLGFLVSGLARA